MPVGSDDLFFGHVDACKYGSSEEAAVVLEPAIRSNTLTPLLLQSSSRS